MSFKKILILLFVLSLFINVALGEKVCVYIFYGEGCPHCKEAREFLSELKNKYELEIHEFEVYYNKSNQKLWEEVSKAYNVKPIAVPEMFIGNKAFVGFAYGSQEVFDNSYNAWVGYSDIIEKTIKEYSEKGVACPSVSGNFSLVNSNNFGNLFIYSLLAILLMFIFYLVFKKVKIRVKALILLVALLFSFSQAFAFDANSLPTNLPLPLLGVILGLLDGIFNPCALSVLLFMIAYLLSINLRKRMLIVGFVFSVMIFTVYFSFMIGVFTVLQILPYMELIRSIVVLLLIVFGAIEIKDFFYYGKGISLSIPSFAHKKIEKLIKAGTIPAALLLGLLVSLVEIPCAGAFPFAYTFILASKGISKELSILYIIWYNIFFVFPLIALTIFFYFSFKKIEKAEKTRKKLRRYMRLVAGLIMILLAILMYLRWL